MCSNVVVIASIGSQDSAQMRLAQDDEMVNTLAPDRSYQPFGKAILPGRGWCGRPVPDAHGTQSARDDNAVNSIPISDHIARGHVPRKASVICRATHSAVGLVVTLVQTRSLRSSRTMTNA